MQQGKESPLKEFEIKGFPGLEPVSDIENKVKMEDLTKFGDVKLQNGFPIHRCKDVWIDGTDTRLFYQPHEEEGMGFHFCAVSWVQGIAIDKPWDKDTTRVEVVCEGVAHWDNVRHLYFGSDQTDNYGYIYFPDLHMIAEVLQQISLLEDKYCKGDG